LKEANIVACSMSPWNGCSSPHYANSSAAFGICVCFERLVSLVERGVVGVEVQWVELAVRLRWGRWIWLR
jgi:hypothetical protein